MSRFSKDVLALNPELADAKLKRKAEGQIDRADDLEDALAQWAPELTGVFTRDLPFLTFRIDLASTQLLLAIEVDGGLMRAGGGKHATSRDKQKIRELVIAGWAVLIFTSSEVHNDPLGCIDDIRRAVEAIRQRWHEAMV